jgi:hypothetical protein
MSDDEEKPQFRPGGLVLGPDGEDSVLVWFDPRCEQIFTRKQVEDLVQDASRAIADGGRSEGNQPGEG